MAITARGIIDSAVGLGRSAVSAGTGLIGRLRGGERATDAAPTTPGSPVADTSTPPATAKTGRGTPATTGTARKKAAGAKKAPSGPPKTVGAAKPGEPGGHKSATAPTHADEDAGDAASGSDDKS